MLKKFFTERKLNIIFSLAAIVLMWLVWIIAYYSVKNEYIVPSFTETCKALWQCFKESSFWISFGLTLARTLLAFVISFAIAALCAVLSVLFKWFAYVIKPVIGFLRTLPTLAVSLLLLIWTSAKVAPVIVTVLILFPMIYAELSASFGGVDRGLLEMCTVYNISRRDRIFKVFVPAVAPNILSQVGAQISLGLKVMISAEVLSNTAKSLGGMMQSARYFIEMPRLAALTIASVILGLIAEIALSQLARITKKWDGRAQ